jgi:hypothetical protein
MNQLQHHARCGHRGTAMAKVKFEFATIGAFKSRRHVTRERQAAAGTKGGLDETHLASALGTNESLVGLGPLVAAVLADFGVKKTEGGLRAAPHLFSKPGSHAIVFLNFPGGNGPCLALWLHAISAKAGHGHWCPNYSFPQTNTQILPLTRQRSMEILGFITTLTTPRSPRTGKIETRPKHQHVIAWHPISGNLGSRANERRSQSVRCED